MILPSQAVQANRQTAMMPGDFVSSILKMFSSTEQVITHSSTTSMAVSLRFSFPLMLLGVGFCKSLKAVLNVKIACNIGNGPENCQLNMVDLEGTLTQVNIYCLSTIGTINMISEAGNTVAKFSDNVNVFPELIALFQLASGTGGSGTYILSSSISEIWHNDFVLLNHPLKMVNV
jgi:hypothetical protein